MARPNYLLRNVLKNPCSTCNAISGQQCDRSIHPELLADGFVRQHKSRIWNRPITEIRSIGLPNEGKNRGNNGS